MLASRKTALLLLCSNCVIRCWLVMKHGLNAYIFILFSCAFYSALLNRQLPITACSTSSFLVVACYCAILLYYYKYTKLLNMHFFKTRIKTWRLAFSTKQRKYKAAWLEETGTNAFFSFFLNLLGKVSRHVVSSFYNSYLRNEQNN